jgi:hypothetical protein
MIPNAELDEKVRSRTVCKQCGHSWFRKEGDGVPVCPECNSPCDDKEHCNVNRKN